MAGRHTVYMAHITHKILACPACEKKMRVRVYDSVNVSIEPKLRELILSDRIHRFDCSQCGHPVVVETTMLYHDMGYGFAAWFLPGGSAKDITALRASFDGTQPLYIEHAPIATDWETFKRTILDIERRTAAWEP